MAGSTDFNDLMIAEGLSAVRGQLKSALQSEPVNDEPVSPEPPSDDGASGVDIPDLAEALQRFAWTVPDGRVWDGRTRKVLREKQVKDWIGKDVYHQWKDHEDRRQVDHESVARAQAAAEKRGGGELAEALQRFVVLYPSQEAWDSVRQDIVPLQDVKVLLARNYTAWYEHPDRKTLDKDRLVFDPTQQVDPETHINMFRGLPLEPVRDSSRCQYLLRLVFSLCNNDRTIYEWLMCWLALPLQQAGTKLQTAVLMHSEVQGSGKSMFFEEVIKRLYGEYGATLGQDQLESTYTGWRSRKLFGLFEEIFSRDQKYSHTGMIKHMVSGKTQRIEEKFLRGWEEANHLNAVFLSNEIQPFPVDPQDRRMLVVWPGRKLPEDIRVGAKDELAADGVEAFYGYLLDWKLEWTDTEADEQTGQPVPVVRSFNEWTEPPMTEAKVRLIDFGRPSWDQFYRSWAAGELEPEFPHDTCLTEHLWQAYRQWCHRFGERAMSYQRFVTVIESRERKRSHMEYWWGTALRKGTFFLVHDPEQTSLTQTAYLSKVAGDWHQALNEGGDDA